MATETGTHNKTTASSLSAVRHIIPVASGKGGVGKSATALNLALALAQEGARVGLLDADIYGPSLPGMLGVPATCKPEVRDGKYFLPVMAEGIATMSIGYLATEKTPMAWRGPMASSALLQMLQQTLWGELDYLLVDMPPGTGDIQLTLAQKIPCTGAVVVTTPQNIALLDARKGIEMFRKVGIDCLGIIENMASHVCSQCGFEEDIFGSGGGDKIAGDYGVQMLGSVPLLRALRESLDAGRSLLLSDPQADISQRYRALARGLANSVAQHETDGAPELIITDD
ncbi:MAG: iron-sulfur cluster carrier protein ApbC [Gammaproteobacteria bacterium]|nr:iron-sulfur cluster carrier protein ApbC [Gammaproteobacteria bacterium]NND39099.1 iron-sulfur cluster carrier protein ApbC [Pseudomonadales bacterium]MBT8151457.1 iron-sulfur cluster carrier protein ApbC [Gammaproteobacteria bacterium]NNL11569.1 iron-sulfur cluster carrier protein ApbC [Pseudomonadales bacterium]NNM10395.1 iron-sulfur cluster carrier protein ApbC [Pseudomonadales bacterium]